jgi:hypothetical protein
MELHHKKNERQHLPGNGLIDNNAKLAGVCPAD